MTKAMTTVLGLGGSGVIGFSIGDIQLKCTTFKSKTHPPINKTKRLPLPFQHRKPRPHHLNHPSLIEILSLNTMSSYNYRYAAAPPYNNQQQQQQPHISNSFYPIINQVPPGSTFQPNSFLYDAPPPQPAGPPQLSNSHSEAGLVIRVQLKPEFRITKPPSFSSEVKVIPHSSLDFDFEFERRIITEGKKEGQLGWSQVETEKLLAPTIGPASPLPQQAARDEAQALVAGVTHNQNEVTDSDPVLSKFIASGLNKEVVSLAVASYGDNPAKVEEFVDGYNRLREMGFSSISVAEALVLYDNDVDKALAYFLHNSS